MDKPKGGRGKKSPYDTTHVRVPVPIKPVIEKIIEQFHRGEDGPDRQILSLSESLEIAEQILKQKKSARLSMQKLLTAIYQTEVTL
jgi:tRNA splicing endonuclease